MFDGVSLEGGVYVEIPISNQARIRSLGFSAVLGMAGVTLRSEPASAIVYCTYVGYPAHCVARAGVVLRPRPVARAAVRANTVRATNRNGGVNRVGVRR